MQDSGSRSTFKYPFPPSIPVDRARMTALVKDYWYLNRTAVNPDTDRFVSHLQKSLNASIVEAKSGEMCLTWRIPKCWRVRHARLMDAHARVIVDFDSRPLALWTHSVSYKGRISRGELLDKHICSDSNRPEESPYHYRNGYRYDAEEWGFSLPYRTVEQLTDPFYVVDIETELDNDGTLKVVDAFLPGKYEDTIFIMAHTCHRGLVSDGIANIAVASELYYYLNALENRTFSYRFLFGPEYFAAAAYLDRARKENVEHLRFGIYLDMLSSHEALGFQETMQGNSRLDKILRNVFRSHTITSIECAYRQLWGNDEMFYNGPGFTIPTAGLSRGMHREYHYDSDNLENMDVYHMVESTWILMRVAEVFESDYVPIRRYPGPLYLYQYNLYVDPAKYRKEARQLEKIQTLIDGERSVMDISDELDLDFFFVRDFLNKLAELDLLEKRPRLPREQDRGTLRFSK